MSEKLKRDEIIRMARMAGAEMYADTLCVNGKDAHGFIERFANIVAAAAQAAQPVAQQEPPYLEDAIVQLVQALKRDKGWTTDYADAIVRDAIDRKHLLEPVAQQGEPVERQYQGRDGVWRSFMSEQHFKDTVADGTWPIRELYTHPAPVAQEVISLLDRIIDSDGTPWVDLIKEMRELRSRLTKQEGE